MKNLNPTSGLRQIISGYICLPRKLVLDAIRLRKIKPIDLGYFIIFLISTDWDRDVNRFGFMRQEMKRLCKMWDLPYSTLEQHLQTLIGMGLIIEDRKTPKIVEFNSFTPTGAQNYSNTKFSDENLKEIFPNLLQDYEISENHKGKATGSFRVSSKGELNVRNKKGEYTDEFVREIEESICNQK